MSDKAQVNPHSETMRSPETAGELRSFWRPALLLLVAFIVYVQSPVAQIADSHFTALAAHQFLHHGDFFLDEYFAHPRAAAYPAQYAVVKVGGHRVHYYPPGATWLALPFTAALERFGVSPVAVDGGYDIEGETRIQRVAAAFLTALALVPLYLMARAWLAPNTALVVVAAAAFATQFWSIASRAVWQHTGVILGGAVVVWAISRAEGARRKLPAAWLASATAWMYLCRPTSSLTVLIVSGYVLLRHPRSSLRYALVGVAWALPLVVYAESVYGALLPGYYTDPMRLMSVDRSMFFNLTGIMISPSRGWWTTVPIAAAIVWLAAVRWRRLPTRAPVILAGAVMCAHLLLLSTVAFWPGATSFGSRYTTDLVPWLTLIAAVALSPRAGGTRPLVAVVLVICVAASAFINSRGAFSQATWGWNRYLATDPPPDAARFWSWRYPQWLAGLVPPVPADVLPTLVPGKALEMGDPASEPYLVEAYGWSGPEGTFRRTDGNDALIAFGFDDTVAGGTFRLVLRLQPFVIEKRLPKQRARIELNGQSLAQLDLKNGQIQDVVIAIPAGVLGRRNILRFRLPDAVALSALGISKDTRQFALSIYELRIDADE